MSYLNSIAVMEAYNLVMDAIKSAKEEGSNEVEWGEAYTFLHDSMKDKIINVHNWGGEHPSYVKDLFMLFGEMLSIMHDGTIHEVERKSIINSVKERIQFLNGGEVMVWVNVYTITQEFGGHEEGGWYYDWRHLADSQPCKYEEAESVEASMREEHGEGSIILGGYEVDVCIEGYRGASRSTHIPHYE